MEGQVYVTRGDIARISADAVAVTRGITFSLKSSAFTALAEHFDPDFTDEYERAKASARPGEAFWVSTARAPDQGPYGAVFVSPKGRAPAGEADHPAYSVVTAAIEMAVAKLRARTPYPILIALIAFRMKFGEDREDRLRSARAQIRAAFDAVSRHPDTDVVFVLDDVTKYEIFLEARRHETAALGKARSPFAYKDLAPLINALQNEECVLFVGAGMSQNSSLTSYPELIREMAGEIGLGDGLTTDVDTALDVAQCFRDQDTDGDRMPALIRKHFGEAKRVKPSLAHYLAMSLPIRFIITTNYDRLLETALEALHRFPLRVVNETQVAQTGYRDGTYVVKFHGDAEKGRVVISRDDYDAFFRDRPEMASLLEGLLLNQTFFFLGYSLRDPNFRQIYTKIELMLRKAMRPAFLTTVEPTPPAARRQYQNKQLKLIETGASSGPDVDSTGDTGAADENMIRKRANTARRLYAFLDRLAEEVVGNTHLFLVPDAHSTSASTQAGTGRGRRMEELYFTLRKAGWQLTEAIQGPMTPEEARTAARILSLLAEQGWQPKNQGASLSGLWERLAMHLGRFKRNTARAPPNVSLRTPVRGHRRISKEAAGSARRVWRRIGAAHKTDFPFREQPVVEQELLHRPRNRCVWTGAELQRTASRF